MSNVDLIRKWMEENPSPNFPTDFDDRMIERFLYVSEQNISRTKDTLKLFFKFRAESPEIFTNRDPSTKSQRSIYDVVAVYPLAKKTPEGYQVYMSHLLDANADKFDFLEYCKMFFTISDVRMRTEEKIPTGDIPIFDMTGFSLKHLMKLVFSPSLVKKYMRITQEAHPVYLKHIHVINTSHLLEKVLTLVRPLMREEVRRMIHFHCEGSNTIFEFVPRDVMPVEFGGEGSSLADLKAHWKKVVDDNKDWIMTEPWVGKSNNRDTGRGSDIITDHNENKAMESLGDLNAAHRIESVASCDTFRSLNLD